MKPLDLLLLALPLVTAAPAAEPEAKAIKPIFGSWGDSIRPFKAGKLGDRFNPPTPEPPIQHVPVTVIPVVIPNAVPPSIPVSVPEPAVEPAPIAEEELIEEQFEPEPEPELEPVPLKQKGSKNSKESSNRSDVTRMAASNSVALFNGVPVDPMTGRPINPPEDDEEEEEEEEESATVEKRGLLKKKLGLGFLSDPNCTDETVREAMKSPIIGMGLAAPKEVWTQPEGAPEYALVPEHMIPIGKNVPPGKPAAWGNALGPLPPAGGIVTDDPALQHDNKIFDPADAETPVVITEPEEIRVPTPKKPIRKPWNSNAYMVVNGVPVEVEGDVTGKALDIAKFAPNKSALQKRGNIREKFGFGTFDMPKKTGRRKKAPVAQDDEIVDDAVSQNDDISQNDDVSQNDNVIDPIVIVDPIDPIDPINPIDPVDPVDPIVHNPIIDDPIDSTDGAQEALDALNENTPIEPVEPEVPQLGKSFVIYNGKAVEVNGSPVRGKHIKKPRPAFRGRRKEEDNEDMIALAKRSAEPLAGRKYSGINPFADNPLTGHLLKPKKSKPEPKKTENPNVRAQKSNSGNVTSEETQNDETVNQTPMTQQDEHVRIQSGGKDIVNSEKPIKLESHSIFDDMLA
ncbi:hypothetical protein BZA77DRAFT_386752 [Pyronema omphalodes]|nr:hypothetical protein BZA77DRAFT_386752 [Pyronema omphalodes]